MLICITPVTIIARTSLMFQSDKSMVELELDLNQKFGEWVALQEAGSQLKPLYGPGYTGLVNLGNSCYMNSLMQVIFTIPDFIKRWENMSDCKFVRDTASHVFCTVLYTVVLPTCVIFTNAVWHLVFLTPRSIYQPFKDLHLHIWWHGGKHP